MLHTGARPAWALPNGNIERAMRQLAGWREVVSPVVLGTGNLPDPLAAEARPLLFVGNHTRFGLFDLPLLVRPSAPPAPPGVKLTFPCTSRACKCL